MQQIASSPLSLVIAPSNLSLNRACGNCWQGIEEKRPTPSSKAFPFEKGLKYPFDKQTLNIYHFCYLIHMPIL